MKRPVSTYTGRISTPAAAGGSEAALHLLNGEISGHQRGDRWPSTGPSMEICTGHGHTPRRAADLVDRRSGVVLHNRQALDRFPGEQLADSAGEPVSGCVHTEPGPADEHPDAERDETLHQVRRAAGREYGPDRGTQPVAVPSHDLGDLGVAARLGPDLDHQRGVRTRVHGLDEPRD